MLESKVEDYLVRRVQEEGGEVRKLKWIGRRNAPDRVVMLPEKHYPAWSGEPAKPGGVCWGYAKTREARTLWVEVKNPATILTFPANAHERAQAREHKRMRDAGQIVKVIGTFEGVEELFK